MQSQIQNTLINEPTQIKRYRIHLVELMSFFHEKKYEKSKQFELQELALVTPDVIYRFFCKKTFGTEAPTIASIPKMRASSMYYWKKSISHFMPNQDSKWDEILQTGNPTISPKINRLIKAVEKKESQGEGKESKEDRPFEQSEVDQIMSILETSTDPLFKYKYATMIRLQIHMIGRIDDISHFKVNCIKANPNYDYTLYGRMKWSKNVSREKDAPDQIILGCWNPKYCVLLSLALYLETYVKLGTPLQFLFCDELQPSDRVKKKIQDDLKDHIFNDNRLVLVQPGHIGSHSFRKFAATYSRRNGGTKEETDARGRWKNSKTASDTYYDKVLPYPDAKIAAKLCVQGGPCKYKLIPRLSEAITDALLLEHVVPITASIFPRNVALTLALPLLWAAFDPLASLLLTPQCKNRILSALPTLTENPVVKIRIKISGEDAQLIIDEVSSNTSIQQSMCESRVFEHIATLESKLDDLKEHALQIKNTVDNSSSRMEKQLTSATNAFRRQAMFAPFRNTTTGGESNNVTATTTQLSNKRTIASTLTTEYQSTLSSCPKTLEALWLEYTTGIGGRKPARLFTRIDIKKQKSSYSRRNNVWERIKSLMATRAECHENANKAIELIYAQYPHKYTVNAIIDEMIREKKIARTH